MEVTAHSLIHNGFLKLHAATFGTKTFEYLQDQDSVSTLLVEQQDNPLHDIITIGRQFRAGAHFGELREDSVFTLASGSIDSGETVTDAAHRESLEEFGAKGHVYKLGSFYVDPSKSTQIANIFWMDVKEWVEPTDTSEGIVPQVLTLQQLIAKVNTPYSVISQTVATAVMLYASQRGV